MNNDLKKQLRKKIPDGESFKLDIKGQMGFQSVERTEKSFQAE